MPEPTQSPKPVAFKRRTFRLFSELQLRYVTLFLLITALGAVVGHLLPRLDALLKSNLPPFRVVSLILLVMIIGGMTYISLFFTNKFAGPIYRLGRYLAEVRSAKNLSARLAFRRYDELHEIAGALNLLLDDLRTDIAYTQDRLEQAIPRLDHLIATLTSQGTSPDPKQVAEKLQEAMEFLIEARSSYQTRLPNVSPGQPAKGPA
jgi:methyl-accepting chemotaxis protein